MERILSDKWRQLESVKKPKKKRIFDNNMNILNDSNAGLNTSNISANLKSSNKLKLKSVRTGNYVDYFDLLNNS